MPRRVATTTISLPKPMYQQLRVYAKKQGRTVSDIIREALTQYYPFLASQKKDKTSWEKLKKELQEISAMGDQTVRLSDFIIQDRQSH